MVAPIAGGWLSDAHVWTRTGDRAITGELPGRVHVVTPRSPSRRRVSRIRGSTGWGLTSRRGSRGNPGAGLPQVSRALGLIADSIASMPWAVYRGRDRQDEPPWLRDPQNAQDDRRVMRTLMPDPMPVVAFRSQMLASLVMHGEAFLYHPNLDEAGYPLPPGWLLNPLDVETVNDYAGVGHGPVQGRSGGP